MINETEYRQRVINHFQNGNPTADDWNWIGMLIIEQNAQIEFMEKGEAVHTDYLGFVPVDGGTEFLDERILTKEEFDELYMDEEEREDRQEYERLKQKFAPVGSSDES